MPNEIVQQNAWEFDIFLDFSICAILLFSPNFPKLRKIHDRKSNFGFSFVGVSYD